jgi:hypothetical protein
VAAREPAQETFPSRVNEKEEEMRAIDRPCGHRFEAETDEELFGLCREHVDRDHPEMQRTDEQLRARIAADAYDAVEVAA